MSILCSVLLPCWVAVLKYYCSHLVAKISRRSDDVLGDKDKKGSMDNNENGIKDPMESDKSNSNGGGSFSELETGKNEESSSASSRLAVAMEVAVQPLAPAGEGPGLELEYQTEVRREKSVFRPLIYFNCLFLFIFQTAPAIE